MLKFNSLKYLSEFDLNLDDLNEGFFFNSIPFNRNLCFLREYSLEQIFKFFEMSGLLEGLEKKGYYNYSIETDSTHSKSQKIFIKDLKSGKNLFFIRMHLGHFISRNLPFRVGSLFLLFIDWLVLQNLRSSSTSKELFPGQRFSGLGLFSEVKNFCTILVKKLNLDGALNLPEYFHDAVLFTDRFFFLKPRSQAILAELRIQLASLGLRRLSKAVISKEIWLKEGLKETIFTYQLGEMIAPNSPALKMYFNSSQYKKIYEKTRSKLRFIYRPL